MNEKSVLIENIVKENITKLTKSEKQEDTLRFKISIVLAALILNFVIVYSFIFEYNFDIWVMGSDIYSLFEAIVLEVWIAFVHTFAPILKWFLIPVMVLVGSAVFLMFMIVIDFIALFYILDVFIDFEEPKKKDESEFA